MNNNAQIELLQENANKSKEQLIINFPTLQELVIPSTIAFTKTKDKLKKRKLSKNDTNCISLEQSTQVEQNTDMFKSFPSIRSSSSISPFQTIPPSQTIPLRNIPSFFGLPKPLCVSIKSMSSPLFDDTLLSYFLNLTKNINALYDDNLSILHIAIINNNIDIIKQLISDNININIQNKDCNTSLHLACLLKSYDIVKLLIDNNINKNIVNIDGYTALHYACINGNENIAELLITNDNINTPNKTDNNTPLHYACLYKNVNIVKLLLSNSNIDIMLRNNYNKLAKEVESNLEINAMISLIELINNKI